MGTCQLKCQGAVFRIHIFAIGVGSLGMCPIIVNGYFKRLHFFWNNSYGCW